MAIRRFFCEVSASYVGILVLYQISIDQNFNVALNRSFTSPNLLSNSDFLNPRIRLNKT